MNSKINEAKIKIQIGQVQNSILSHIEEGKNIEALELLSKNRVFKENGLINDPLEDLLWMSEILKRIEDNFEENRRITIAELDTMIKLNPEHNTELDLGIW